MAGDAIIFRAGVDASSVKQGMQNAANEIEKGSKQAAAAGNKAAEAQDNIFKSGNRVAKQIVNVTSSFVSGASAADILSSSVVGLEKSLKLPLGALAGLGVGVMVFEKLRESSNDIKDLNAGIAEAIHPTSSADYSKLEDLQAKLKQINEQRDKLSDSGTGFALKKIESGVYNNLKSIFTGQWGSLHNFQDDDNLSKEQERQLGLSGEEIKASIAKKVRTSGDLEDLRQHGAGRDYELSRISAEFDERIGGAEDISKGGDPEIAQALKRQKALAKEAANHRADLAQMTFEHQSHLLDVHSSGDQVAVRTAKGNLGFAQNVLAEAKNHGNEEEQRTAELRVKSAKEELELAQRKEAISERERINAVELANSALNADAKHLLELQKQSEELRAQRATAKPDEIFEIDAKIAQNSAAQRDFTRSSIRRGFSITDTAIDAETGIGEGERLKAAQRHLENARRDQNFVNLPGSHASGEDIVGQAAKVKQLENSIDELNQHRRDGVNIARQEADIQEAQVQGHNTVADVMRIEAEFGERIAQAQRDKNGGLVEQLQRQQSIALHAAAVDDILDSPADRRAKRANARHRNQADRVDKDHAKDLADRGARGAHNLHRLGDHDLGPRNAPITATLDAATTAAIQQSIQIAMSTLNLYGMPIPGS